MRELRDRYQPDAEISPQRDDQAGVTIIDVSMGFNQLLELVSRGLRGIWPVFGLQICEKVLGKCKPLNCKLRICTERTWWLA